MLRSLMGIGTSELEAAGVAVLRRESKFSRVVPSLSSVLAHASKGGMAVFSKLPTSKSSPVLNSKPVAASLLFGRSVSASTGVDHDWIIKESGSSRTLCFSRSVSYWDFLCKFSEGESFKVWHQGLDGVLKPALSFDGVKLESADPVLLNQLREVLISQLPAHIVSDRKVSHAELLKDFTAQINQSLSLKSLEAEAASEDLSL